MTKQFYIGDIVICVEPHDHPGNLPHGKYRVAGIEDEYGDTYLTVEPLDGQTCIKAGWLPFRFELAKANAPRTPATPQARKVLKLLASGERLSRVTAMHYGVMNLTARLADLRNAGWDVRCEIKRDVDGNRYGSFSLAGEQLPLAA